MRWTRLYRPIFTANGCSDDKDGSSGQPCLRWLAGPCRYGQGAADRIYRIHQTASGRHRHGSALAGAVMAGGHSSVPICSSALHPGQGNSCRLEAAGRASVLAI